MANSDLWSRYREAGSREARDELVSENLPLVYHVAHRMLRTRRGDLELDDLVSAGTMGLIDAVENFDPDRGVAFSTFASMRIRGAILDDFRRRDPVPRTIRRKRKAIRDATETLERELDRAPTDEEVARELEIRPEKLRKWRRDAQCATPVSLDARVESDEGEGREQREVLPDEDAEEIDRRIERSEEVERLRDAILELDEQARIVISLYYYEELTLREIGEVLDLSESRISQIRSKALHTLRSRLSHLVEEVA